MDKNKTKTLLFDELRKLRKRNAELEKFQTRHNQEKKKLQESENIYKSIFESFYDVYYRTDKDGLITLISPSIQTQAGYDPKEVIGLPVTDFYYNPDDREVFIEKLKENGSINDYESQLLAKDGRLIDVSISSRILVGKDGTPQGIEGILRDITERKKREEDQFLINELNNALNTGKSLQDIIQLTSVMTKKMFSGLGARVYLIDNSNTYLELQNSSITSVFVKKIEKLINIKIPAVKIPMDSDHIYIDLLQKKEIRLSNTPAMIQQVMADFFRTMEFGGKVLSKITKKMKSQFYKTLNLKSIFTVPLVSEDEVIGLLSISSMSRFSELDLERIKLIAGQLTSIIKRKQTEKALKESEEKLRSISDSAKDAIIMADNLGDITHWNPAAEHLFGYSEEEATRYNLADIIHSGSRPKQLSKRLQNFGKTGKDSIMGKTAELEVTRKDGKTIPVELSLSAIKIKDKWHSVGILRDITERKQTETALQESEARFRTLSNSAFECIVITDKGRMLDTNEQFNKIFGYKRSELIGQPIIDLVAPESRELVKKNILSGYEKSYEHQALHKDGTIFTVEVIGKSIPYDGHQVRVTAIRDITERKQAEKALRQSEEKYRMITENSPAVSWTTSEKGETIFISSNLERVYGYNPKEIYKQGTDLWLGRIHPEDKGQVLQEFQALFNKDKPYDVQYRIQRKDGEWIWIHDKASIIRTIEGVRHAFGIFSDITERKQAEEELRNSEERLKILFESAPDAYYLTDLKGKFIDGNRAAEKVTGYKKGELVGKSFLEIKLLSKKQILKAGRLLVKNARGQATGPDEFILHQKDGTHIIAEIRTFPVKIKGKTLVLGIARDITDRKNAEKAIRESENRLKLAMEAARDGLFDWNMETGDMYFSPRYYTMLGYEPYEMPAAYETWISLLHPGDRDYAVSIIQEYIDKKRKSHKIEIRLKTKSGGWRWVLSRGKLIEKNEKGATKRMVGTHSDITERKQAEEDMRQYEHIVSSSTDMIALLNNQFKYLAANNAYLDAFNLTSEKLIGHTASEVFGEKFFETTIKANAEQCLQGEKINYQDWFEFPAFGKKYMDVTYSPYIDKDNEVKGFVVNARNITDRKKAEEELINSNFWLEESQRVSKIGSYIFDIPKNNWTSSKILDDIFGISDTDNKDFAMWVNIVHPEQKEEMLSYFQNEVLEKHVPFNKEYRIVRISDGEERWVHGLGELSFDENNNPVKMLGTIQDITERKLAEEERLLLSTAVEQSTEIIFITGIDSTIQYINPSFNKIAGFSQDEVIGKSASIFFKNGDRNLFDTIQEVLKQGNSWSGHFNSRKKDESLFEVESTISPIRDRSQKIINHVYVLRDVTREMTIERQLQQAQKMEALGTLSGGIAHDFNNILTCIIGYTELALSDMPKGTLLERNLKQVYSAGKRGEDLVKQILAFSRQSEIEKKPVQVNLIIQEALKLLRSSTPVSIQINHNIQSDSTVLADPTQIHQVFMNLFTNSLDAVREKGGTVDVDLEDVWLDEDFKKKHPNIHPGQHIKLSVKDTGHGIEKSIVKQIFDPFFTTKELGKGTGLGLSVVHGIVKNHGGAISLDSEPNKGTTFHVFLPIDKNLVLKKEQVSTSIQGGQERILLVDDEPQVVNLEKQILERLGYTVETRENPLEALKDFRAQPGSYDLVITDLTMPKMTGGELALQLLQIKPDIPIILCTGYSETMSEEKAKSLGIKEFIMKPIKKKNFADSIRKVLDREPKRG